MCCNCALPWFILHNKVKMCSSDVRLMTQNLDKCVWMMCTLPLFCSCNQFGLFSLSLSLSLYLSLYISLSLFISLLVPLACPSPLYVIFNNNNNNILLSMCMVIFLQISSLQKSHRFKRSCSESCLCSSELHYIFCWQSEEETSVWHCWSFLIPELFSRCIDL